MTPTAKALLIVLSIAIGISAWMTRVGVSPTGSNLSVHVVDRWTGTVYLCGLAGTSCQTLYPK